MATCKVKLTQPLKYFGGKRYLADRFISLMPPHLVYCEPYFGGGAVLLQKDPEGVSEVVNDINSQLSNFWETLRWDTPFQDFMRIMSATPFSEELWVDEDWHLEWECEAPKPCVRCAAAFFVRCRQSRAGMFKDFATVTRSRTRRGMNEQVSAWLNTVEGLPAVHARLKRVLIMNRDALDVIRQQDGPQTLFYLDPPYLHSTRTAGGYAHEMTEHQHEQLLLLLSRIEGKFLLSGYPSDLYTAAEITHGWKRHDFQIDNKAAGGATKREMTECVWANFGS